MKNTIFIMLIAFVLCAFSGCGGKAGNKAGNKSASPQESFDKDTSYALGMEVGSNLKMDNIHPDVKAFVRGMQDVLNDAPVRYTVEQARDILSEKFDAIREQREAAYKQAEIEFLAENSQKPGINTTESGLQYEVIREGDGPKPSADDTVLVYYVGTLIDGTVFDSSYAHSHSDESNRRPINGTADNLYFSGEPSVFPLSEILSGWTEGLQLMSVGGRYRLFVPSELAYGEYGRGSEIPPYSTLICEIELLSIE